MRQKIVLRDPVIRDNSSFIFDWKDNLSIQKLLDVIAAILSEEYISVARDNPNLFKKEDLK